MVKSFYSVFDLFVGEILEKWEKKLLRGVPGPNVIGDPFGGAPSA